MVTLMVNKTGNFASENTIYRNDLRIGPAPSLSTRLEQGNKSLVTRKLFGVNLDGTK